MLNCETGEPLHTVEERPVPTGGVKSETLSPTQPYSGHAALNKPPLTEKDMWGMSPLDQPWCRIQFNRANYEVDYTPPSTDRPWIQYPGYDGGSDWGSVAVDSEHGSKIANYNDMPNFNRLIPRGEADARGLRSIAEGGSEEGAQGSPQAGALDAIDVNAGWPAVHRAAVQRATPRGDTRAIGLYTGDAFGTVLLDWRATTGLGASPRCCRWVSERRITAGGLVSIAATTDDIFRATDVETGEELWRTVLPAGGQATPISYEADGEQYIVISPGGHHFMETQAGDYVIAYRLKKAD